LPWALEVQLVMQRIKAPTPAATAGAQKVFGSFVWAMQVEFKGNYLLTT
jgi:hypothetical protein